MSQVEELLNSSSIDMVTESEPHVVIGIDRFVTVPNELKRIAVQYDHNMRTVTFDCPRYYDGRDMSTMKVYINVAKPDGTGNSYIADNVVVDTDDSNMIHFDWTITRVVTEHKGNIAFLVCIRKTDENGNEENHWNSELSKDMYISEGLECDDIFEYEYPDIITQLLQRMDAVENSGGNSGTGTGTGTGVTLTFDNTLKMTNGVLSVNTTNEMEQDNTLPITSAGVYATVGNIEALLKTI